MTPDPKQLAKLTALATKYLDDTNAWRALFETALDELRAKLTELTKLAKLADKTSEQRQSLSYAFDDLREHLLERLDDAALAKVDTSGSGDVYESRVEALANKRSTRKAQIARARKAIAEQILAMQFRRLEQAGSHTEQVRKAEVALAEELENLTAEVEDGDYRELSSDDTEGVETLQDTSKELSLSMASGSKEWTKLFTRIKRALDKAGAIK